MYYLSFDFIIYKITRGIDIINDNIKMWWVNTFVRHQQDQGYTVIDRSRGDRYVSYDELWEL
jgi:hypothetical protein